MLAKWPAHGGGGRVVIACGSRAWVGATTSGKLGYEPLPREALPPAPLQCVATDGRHVVLVGGAPSLPPDHDDDDEAMEGAYQVVVFDMQDHVVCAVRDVEYIGDHLGIVAGHVVMWQWYAQGDLLDVIISVQLNGDAPRVEADLVEDHFDCCGAFGAHGDVIAGTIDYNDMLYLGALGEQPRAVRVPRRFGNPDGFAFIGFDHAGSLVLTIRGLEEGSNIDRHHAWRLDGDDSWVDLGAWTVNGGYDLVRDGRAVEFAGADGRPVRLTEADFPR